MANLVTGEAVELELRPAQLPSRMLALGVDVVIEIVVLAAVMFAVSEAAPVIEDPALGAALIIVVFVAAFVGWPVAWESLGHGRTPGKLMLGLRVVRDDGGPVRFRHALVRGLVGVFADFWLTMGIGAVLSSLISRRGKRLGDIAAGTFVVRERTPGGKAALGTAYAALPPQVAAWAATLDLSAYPDHLALAARQYLGRAAQLEPSVAAALAGRLAAETAACLRVPVPPGMHPAAFLTAVLTERQRRAYGRSGGPAAVPHGAWGAPAPGPASAAWPAGAAGQPAGPYAPPPQPPQPPSNAPGSTGGPATPGAPGPSSGGGAGGAGFSPPA